MTINYFGGLKFSKVKTFFFLIIFFLGFLFGCNKDDSGVIITGEIEGLISPVVYFSFVTKDSIYNDSVMANALGEFKYKVSNGELPRYCVVFFNNYKSSTIVFLEKDLKVRLCGNANLSDMIKAKGGEINNDLMKFKKDNEALLNQRGLLLMELNNEIEDVSESSVFKNTDLVTNLKTLDFELALKAEEFIERNPTKRASLVLIHDFFKDSENPKSLERVLSHLGGEIREEPLVISMEEYLKKIKRFAEGSPAPMFKLLTSGNKEISLDDYKDKALFLSFISDNDTESIVNIQKLSIAYENTSRKEIEFISIIVDYDDYTDDFKKKNSVPWIVVPLKDSWASKIVKDYNVQYLPFNILIDKEHNILTRNIFPSEIELKLNSMK